MKFSQEEVTAFCELVGDTNPIHKSNIGIVPGLMVTSIITKDPDPDIMLAELKVKYSQPLYVGEEVELVITSLKEKMGSRFIDYEIRTEDRVIQKLHCILVRYRKNLDRREQKTTEELGDTLERLDI